MDKKNVLKLQNGTTSITEPGAKKGTNTRSS
jgi:hypothetical protein